MTEIRESNFSIDLPGEWEKAESPEAHVAAYKDAQDDATLTVTLLGVKPMFMIADQRRLLGDYLHHRSKFEKGRAQSLLQSEAVTREQDGRVEGAWSAFDPDTGRRMQHHIVLVSGLLADFVFEAAEADEDVFLQRAESIFATATVTAG